MTVDAIKDRAGEIVDAYYETVMDMGMLDRDGVPMVGYCITDEDRGGQVRITEHGPVNGGSPYFTVSVTLGKCYAMQALTVSASLKSRLKEELVVLLRRVIKESRL